MACYFVVIFILLSCSSGSPVHSNRERTKGFYYSPKQVCINVFRLFFRHALNNSLPRIYLSPKSHFFRTKAGKEYNEKIEVEPNKRTELFEVPAHPEVDRSDTLHDYKPVSFSSLRSTLI